MNATAKQLLIGALTIVIAWLLIEGVKWGRTQWRIARLNRQTLPAEVPSDSTDPNAAQA